MLKSFVGGINDFGDRGIERLFRPGIGEPAETKGARLEIGSGGVSESGFVDGQCAAVEKIVAGDGGEDAGAILSAACEWPDFIHGIGESHRAITAYSTVGGAKTADSAEG